jgi:hypothetical protein
MSGERGDMEKYSICANLAHDRDPIALAIYRVHRPHITHYNAHGWLLYFTNAEIRKLEDLVKSITKSERLVLPMVDVDALSVDAISIYTYGDKGLLQKMREIPKIKINLANRA